MRRIAQILSFFAIFTIPALAITPKNPPPNLPPLRTPPRPRAIPQLPIGPPVILWTQEMIDNLGISSTMKRDFLAHLQFVNAFASTSTAAESRINASGGGESAARKTLRPSPNTTVIGTAQSTADALDDIEPSIITNRFNVDRTTIAFTKFDATNTPFHYWTSTTDYINFIGYPTGQQFQLPAGTNRSSDPMLAENAYNSNIQPNAFPKRTYCIGSAYDINAQGVLDYDELTVWYTDDPGSIPWTRVTPVIDSVNNPLLIDKPSIFTSWDTTHGTLGYTYAAAVVVNISTNSHQLRVYRQTSTLGFTLVNGQFLSSTNLQSPIITVDNATGDVYLLWCDWTLNTINIARSTNMGTNFVSGAVTFSTGTLLNGNGIIRDNSGNVTVRASSTIMARPNAANNSIGVVWHQREADGAHTDVFFNSFSLATQTWNSVQHLGHTAQNDGRDQWNAALDPASDGAYMVTWYDKRQDPNNDQYLVYAEKVNADGTAIDTADSVVYNAAATADPALLLPIGGLRYLGDYQDVWEWFGTWYSGTIYLDRNGQEDTYLPRIQP